MMDARVDHIRLGSGMRVLARRNAANPTVSLKLAVAAGAADDPRQKAGLAAFAAALMTKGTTRRSATWIAEKIDSLGLELAFAAGRHSFGMAARVLGDRLRPALALAAELLSRSEPPADEVERMRERILADIRLRSDDPASVAADNLSRLIYGAGHPYGRPVHGDEKSVARIARQDILQFYSDRLAPGATACVLVGDFDPESLEEDLADTLGRWRGGGEFKFAAPRSVRPPAEPKSRRIMMPGKTQSDIALGFPGIDRRHDDYYSLTVGNTVLGRLSLGGRIGRRVRDEEGMAYYSYTAFDAGVGAGPFVYRAGVNPAHIDRALELAIEEMRRARDGGIEAEEMADAVVFLDGAMSRQVETNAGMAATLLNQEIFGLGDDFYLRFESIIRALSLEDVNAALARHLHVDNYCLAVAGPPS